ncbi:MAG: di-heme-cytochrome C peroxidase, partial [Gammaproteobacteria bacterium]
MLFSDHANLKRYGFIEAENSNPLNPYGLPIGFAVDTHSIPGRGPSLGFTCAACHTSNVTVKGKVIRGDGAPANLDFDTFYAELAAVVAHTYFDEDAFKRFANRVLPDPTPLTIGELRLQFTEFQAMMAGEAVMRRPVFPSGFGRVDALTQIINTLSVLGQKEPTNLRAVKAPVSYPHLWLTPQLEFVQWDPVAANPIARNAGEALGVFVTVKLHGPKEEWYDSSLLINELYALEQWVKDLKPPPWETNIFGAFDQALAATGEALYKDNCVICHNAPPYQRTDPAENPCGKTFIKIGRTNYKEVGTDPLYIEALLQRLVRTNEATVEINEGKSVVPALLFFKNTVGAVVIKAMDELKLS